LIDKNNLNIYPESNEELLAVLVKSEDGVFLLATRILEGAIIGDRISLILDEEEGSDG